ncbi:hypothetical protein ACLOJK_027311 [Asimina triloba]
MAAAGARVAAAGDRHQRRPSPPANTARCRHHAAAVCQSSLPAKDVHEEEDETHHLQAILALIQAAHHNGNNEHIPDPSRLQANDDHSGHTRQIFLTPSSGRRFFPNTFVFIFAVGEAWSIHHDVRPSSLPTAATKPMSPPMLTTDTIIACTTMMLVSCVSTAWVIQPIIHGPRSLDPCRPSPMSISHDHRPRPSARNAFVAFACVVRTMPLEPDAYSHFHRLVRLPPLGASCSPFCPCHRCR